MSHPAIALDVSRLLKAFLFAGAIAAFMSSTYASGVVAHWTLNQPLAPFLDSSGASVTLSQDAATTPVISGVGIAGGSVQLNFQNPPGTSTRLYATNSALETDSFGFSFWIRPLYLNTGDNLIAREMPYNTSVSGNMRLSWQVRIAETNVSGTAPLEFIVRGDNPSQGTFFGNVFSMTNLPLFTAMTAWIHVAGGYNSKTGALNLFVNGVESMSTNSAPGAQNSDDSAFDIGTAKNGPDFVAFSAGTYIDDVQLYNGPLSPSDVAFLMANPGQDIRPFVITSMTFDPASGNVTATITSTNSPNFIYTVAASTNLITFMTVTNIVPATEDTTILLPQSTLDTVFGDQPRSVLYLTVEATTSFSGCQ